MWIYIVSSQERLWQSLSVPKDTCCKTHLSCVNPCVPFLTCEKTHKLRVRDNKGLRPECAVTSQSFSRRDKVSASQMSPIKSWTPPKMHLQVCDILIWQININHIKASKLFTLNSQGCVVVVGKQNEGREEYNMMKIFISYHSHVSRSVTGNINIYVTRSREMSQFSCTTFSKLQNASFWCRPHYNWISGYRVMKDLTMLKTI